MSLIKKQPRRSDSPRLFFSEVQRSLIIIIVLSVLIMLIPIAPVIILTREDTSDVLYYTRIKENQKFSLTYIHSIHLTPVTEVFEVNKELNLVAKRTIFDTYGVGIPSEVQEGQSFKIEDGKFILDNVNLVLPYFDQRVGQVIANHKLKIDDMELPLSNIIEPGDWIRFQAVKWNMWQLMKGGT